MDNSINRRDFVKLAGAAPFAGILGCQTQNTTSQKPLNFIIIMDDQHNSKHLGHAELNDGVKTPNLDKLASQSVTFQNAYTSCPVCGPSRHSIYTGLYASQHGVLLNGRPMKKDATTIMSTLADSGYTTANIGKMHFAPYNLRNGFQYILNHEFYQNNGGISHFYPEFVSEVKKRNIKSERLPDWNYCKDPELWQMSMKDLAFGYDFPEDMMSEHWVTDQAVNFIEDQQTNRPDKPFFLHVSYFGPHHPYGPPEKFNTYDPEEMTLPPSWSKQKAERFRAKARKLHNIPALSEKEYKEIKAHYFGYISFIDYQIGRLLDWLDSNPELAENTVVMFLSDHGDKMGEHGHLFKGKNQAMLDGSAAIPFIIRWPGVKAKKENSPVSVIDIAPTILNAAGINNDKKLPGSNLKPLMETEQTSEFWKSRTVFSQWFSPVPFRYIMAKKQNFKLIADNKIGDFSKAKYELYDMENDKWEMNNLADNPEYKTVLDGMKTEILEHYQTHKQYVPDVIPPEVPRSIWDIELPHDPWKKVQPKGPWPKF